MRIPSLLSSDAAYPVADPLPGVPAHLNARQQGLRAWSTARGQSGARRSRRALHRCVHLPLVEDSSAIPSSHVPHAVRGAAARDNARRVLRDPPVRQKVQPLVLAAGVARGVDIPYGPHHLQAGRRARLVHLLPYFWGSCQTHRIHHWRK